MTSFDDREKAQENKYAHDEHQKFKATARATKLFGVWVAEKLGVPAEAYATELVNLTTSGKTQNDLFKKIGEDATAKGQNLSLDLLAEKYNRCLSEAKDQIAKS